MNGWQRLGVVISAFIAVPSAWVVYAENSSIYERYLPSPSINSLSGQGYANAAWDEGALILPRLKQCVRPSIRVYRDGDYAEFRCSKDPSFFLRDMALAAAIPFTLVFGLGYVFAWVRRGFRQPAR